MTVRAPDRPDFDWRYNMLVKAGFPPDDAIELAGRPDLDVHRAVDLIESGCPLAVALRILR